MRERDIGILASPFEQAVKELEASIVERGSVTGYGLVREGESVLTITLLPELVVRMEASIPDDLPTLPVPKSEDGFLGPLVDVVNEGVVNEFRSGRNVYDTRVPPEGPIPDLMKYGLEKTGFPDPRRLVERIRDVLPEEEGWIRLVGVVEGDQRVEEEPFRYRIRALGRVLELQSEDMEQEGQVWRFEF